MFFLPFLADIASSITDSSSVDTLQNVSGVREPSFGWLLFKTIGALGLVIFLAYAVLKFLLPKLYQLSPRSGGSIQVIERFGLEPRKTLYLVKVGDSKLLLGVSENSITTLSKE